MAANSSFSHDPSASGAQVQYSLNSKAMVAAMLILCIVVLFVLTLHVYAKWFWHQRSVGALPLSNAHDAPWRRRHRWRLQPAEFTGVDGALAPTMCVGLDPTTISSLPTFIYQASKHNDVTKPLLECAVCLSEFQPYEKGRILPDCKHSFHISCIDMWFCSHSTCPLCRAPVLPWTPQHHEQNTWAWSDSTSLALPTTRHDQHIEQTTSHSQHLQIASSTSATNQCPNELTPHCNSGIHVQGQHQEGFSKNDELLPSYDAKAEARASLWRIDGTCESSSTRSASVEIQGQAESGASIARCQSLGIPRCQTEDTEACALQPIKSRSFRMSIRWLLSRDLSRARGRIFPSAAGDEGAEEQDHQIEQSSSRSTLPL